VLGVEPEWAGERRIGINCANGFVALEVGKEPVLIPHDPELRQRHMLEAEWHGPIGREGSMLDRLLTGCFKGDVDAEEKIALIGEMMGAAAGGFATRLVQPRAWILIGITAENGKSQVLIVMRGLVAKGAASAISPSMFKDKSYLIKLAGKLLNA